MDTMPDALKGTEQFLLNNPFALQQKYLTLKYHPSSKVFKMEMRNEVLAGEKRALEMLVDLFDWLDGLNPRPITDIVDLYHISQSIEAMITNTFAKLDQATTKKVEIDRLFFALKNSSKVSASPCLGFNLILV